MAQNKITNSEGERNTKEKVHPRIRCRNWFLTWNNYTEDDISSILALGAEKCMMQEEKGAQGTIHLQGVLCFKNPKDFSNLKEECEGCHWEKCKNIYAAKNYCSKLPTSNGRKWCWGWEDKFTAYTEDFLSTHKPYKWQQLIIDMCKSKPNKREILWLYDSIGNKGKTELVKHLVYKYGAIVVGGQAKDAYFAIQQQLEKKKKINIVIFSLTRSEENHISYKAIEGIKDGMFFSSKYESGMCLFDVPHVIIFANFGPNVMMLSTDRWKIGCLDKIN